MTSWVRDGSPHNPSWIVPVPGPSGQSFPLNWFKQTSKTRACNLSRNQKGLGRSTVYRIIDVLHFPVLFCRLWLFFYPARGSLGSGKPGSMRYNYPCCNLLACRLIPEARYLLVNRLGVYWIDHCLSFLSNRNDLELLTWRSTRETSVTVVSALRSTARVIGIYFIPVSPFA